MRAAAPTDLDRRFEAAIHELRSLLTAGEEVPEANTAALARAAGETLWRHAHEAQETADRRGASTDARRGWLADTTHTAALNRLLAIAADLGAPTALATRLAAVRTQLEAAGRGATGVRFDRPGSGAQQVNVLVTGFDPFNTENHTQPPRTGEWNASGAAALALDGTGIPLGGGRGAAVEGIVFPVDFAAFRGAGGYPPIVERYVSAALSADPRGVDAIITVSVVSGEPTGTPVQLERYSVGMHQLLDERFLADPPRERLPKPPPGGNPLRHRLTRGGAAHQAPPPRRPQRPVRSRQGPPSWMTRPWRPDSHSAGIPPRQGALTYTSA